MPSDAARRSYGDIMTKYIAGLSFLFIAACGGGAPEEAPKAEEKTEKVEEKPAEDKAKSEDKAKAKAKAKKKEGPNIVTIEGDVASVALEGSDTMQFNATEIRVKKGNKS